MKSLHNDSNLVVTRMGLKDRGIQQRGSPSSRRAEYTSQILGGDDPCKTVAPGKKAAVPARDPPESHERNEISTGANP